MTEPKATPTRAALFATCLVETDASVRRLRDAQAAEGGRSRDGDSLRFVRRNGQRPLPPPVRGRARVGAPRRGAGLAAKTYELTQFLVDVLGVSAVPRRHPGVDAYHDSCSSRREMHVHGQPRALLAAAGAEIRNVENAEDCCGFGGTFSVKMADVSGAMVDAKAQAVIATGADTLLFHRRGRTPRHPRPPLYGAVYVGPMGSVLTPTTSATSKRRATCRTPARCAAAAPRSAR